MALDRQSIEKKDFPIGRRGYEPEAVDAHLAQVASEFEAAQRRSGQPQGGASLASAASEQVRAIVEAAETSAAEIERAAKAEADRIRGDAQAEADRTRGDAVQRSQEHVSKVAESTSLMLQRVDAMESELTALVDSLRTGANRLNADLALLQGNMGELYGQGAAAAPAPAAPEPRDEPEPEPTAADVEDEAATVAQDLEPEPVSVSASGGGGDVEGARLIALNMALNGQPREETDRYLSENFDLSDRDALLDEVYATVEG